MPKRLCLAAGCPDVPTHRGYCAAHNRAKDRAVKRHGQSLYRTAKWRNTRKAVLSASPLCKCGAIATDADHIVPLAKGGAPYDLENLQALCRSCHGRKTYRETFGVGWPD